MNVDIQKVKDFIESNKVTQTELASILGISRQSLNYRLTGKVKFTLQDMLTISKLSKKSVSYFLS